MSQIINFSTLQLLSSVDIYDQFFIRLNNGLSGFNGYGRATYDTIFSNLSVSSSNVSVSSNSDIVVSSNSANWNNTFTNFSIQSANNIAVYSTVNTNSNNWDSAYTVTNTNSARWNNVYTNFSYQSANNIEIYSNVNSNSANWNNLVNVVQTNSAEWSTFTPTANATTSYILSASNNHDIIYCTSASPNLVIIPPSLGVGFECTIIQNGIGQTTISASSGASLQSFGNLTKLAGQYARAHIVASVVADEYNLTGTLVS